MTEEGFWGMVRRCGPEACWPWEGARGCDGYGVLRWGGRLMYAHRVAFALSGGELGPGVVVRHGCDVPWCCNPGHLQAGSQAQNVRDMVRRGRYRRARLSASMVRRMRAEYALGMSTRELASRTGWGQRTVVAVVRGERYRRV